MDERFLNTLPGDLDRFLGTFFAKKSWSTQISYDPQDRRLLLELRLADSGLYGEGAAAQLKIAVHAPPIEGRANLALIAFLADTFDLPKNSVELISGELSRSKVFLLRGVTLKNAESLLSQSVPLP